LDTGPHGCWLLLLGGPFHPRERNVLHWEKISRVVRINSFEKLG